MLIELDPKFWTWITGPPAPVAVTGPGLPAKALPNIATVCPNPSPAVAVALGEDVVIATSLSTIIPA